MIYPRQVVYALEALSYLAAHPSKNCIKVKELAKELNIPRHFLGKVLTELVKKKFVNSIKGPKGGFSLAINTSNISIYRILAVIGGLEKLEGACVMGFKRCRTESPCALHGLWTEFKEHAVFKTQKLTLEEFSRTFTNCQMQTGKITKSSEVPYEKCNQ